METEQEIELWEFLSSLATLEEERLQECMHVLNKVASAYTQDNCRCVVLFQQDNSMVTMGINVAFMDAAYMVGKAAHMFEETAKKPTQEVAH